MYRSVFDLFNSPLDDFINGLARGLPSWYDYIFWWGELKQASNNDRVALKAIHYNNK